MKRLYTIDVRGKERSWAIPVMADPAHVEDWRADGLEVDEVMNTIPAWVAELGYWPTRAWLFAQDVFNFRNPFKQ